MTPADERERRAIEEQVADIAEGIEQQARESLFEIFPSKMDDPYYPVLPGYGDTPDIDFAEGRYTTSTTCGFDMGDWAIGNEDERTPRKCQRPPHEVIPEDRSTWHHNGSGENYIRLAGVWVVRG